MGSSDGAAPQRETPSDVPRLFNSSAQLLSSKSRTPDSMNALLLDALASPPKRTTAGRLGNGANKENLSTSDDGIYGRHTGSYGVAEEIAMNRCDMTKECAAPLRTVSSQGSVPGRMENLRILIEEGKQAAAEGRIGVGLRKYETAMVNLPEAYKPRLRRKMTRLEEKLRDQSQAQRQNQGDSSSRGPRQMPRNHKSILRESMGNLGPVDLLQIAVQELSLTTNSADESESVSRMDSPRRPSPLARELPTSAHTTSGVPQDHLSSLVHPEQVDPNVRRANSFPTDHLAFDIESERVGKAPDPTKNIKEDEREKEREEGRFGKRFGGRVALEGQPPRPCSARGNETILEESDTRSDGRNHGKSDARRPASGTDRTAPEDDVGTRTENQDCPRAMNEDLSKELERQVVDILNQASSQELTQLHGIGARRAQLIMRKRATMSFRTLGDLTRIGMYPKEIRKMGKHNMLERLDVLSGSERSAV